MLLRSGKTVFSTRLSFDNTLSPDNSRTPTLVPRSGVVANHTENIVFSLDIPVSEENILLQDTTYNDALKKWVFFRIDGLLSEVSKYDTIWQSASTSCVLDYIRLLSELTHVVYSYVDIMTSSPELRKISTLLITAMGDWKSHMTVELLCVPMVYHDVEKQYIGNVRADIVKTAILLQNRLHGTYME